MLRILKKTATSPSARAVGSVPAAYGDDLSTWELVSPSLSDDDDDVFSFDGDDDVISVISDVTASEQSDSDDVTASETVTSDHVISFQALSVSPPMTVPVGITATRHQDDVDVGDDVDGGDDVVPDDDSGSEDDVGGYDVDDELVPWKLKGKLGKERIRKLGKRGGPSRSKSKRMPFYYNRPGCVYGKHGFGVQHSFV